MELQSAIKKEKEIVFSVWAPGKEKMSLHIVKPVDKQFEMQKNEEGYWNVSIEHLPGDVLYFFKPDGEKDYPDPTSNFQPQGVHGPSQLVIHKNYKWNDEAWKGIPLEEMIIYELHVGTFTDEGNFESIICRLDELKELGINAIEIMPIAQFPGNRNWGYDGVFPYAVQNSYGGPDGLKKLVDACHQKNIAIILDVVYNHLGPEGNYFSLFGPYFTDKYHTPWGDAINFDGEWSDGVRDYFSNNIIYWFDHYHIDGLRCDAIHAIFDNGAVHFWQKTQNEIAQLEKSKGRKFHLIAESDLNDPKVVKAVDEGGFGFTAQWLDDFHHALYVLLNPADQKRYYDFYSMKQLAKAYTDGFVHSGEWVRFRKRKYGASSAGIPGNKFIVFSLNHDQVGNRVDGARLCMQIDFERIKLAAAAVLLSPYVPMFFMGEEYADDTPFFYFVSHSDKELIKAVQEGRKNEFREFGFDGESPDPQSEETFNSSKIHWEKRNEGHHKVILQWHKELIGLRNTNRVFKNFLKKDITVETFEENGFTLMRKSSVDDDRLICLFNLSEKEISFKIPDWFGNGKKILDSKDDQWVLKKDHNKPHALQIKSKDSFCLAPLSVVVYYNS